MWKTIFSTDLVDTSFALCEPGLSIWNNNVSCNTLKKVSPESSGDSHSVGMNSESQRMKDQARSKQKVDLIVVQASAKWMIGSVEISLMNNFILRR